MNKDRNINIRCTSEDIELVKYYSNRVGKTVSDYILSLLYEDVARVKQLEEFFSRKREVTNLLEED